MPTPPYPLQPEPMKKSWLERNPNWKIPLGCLMLVFLVAAFGATLMTIIVTSFRHSDVYAQAMAQALQNPQVRDQLGEPIQAAWLISGQINVSNNTGHADLSIPISGPKGQGSIHGVANKVDGAWRFTLLQVSIHGHGDVDLLPNE
ncbi:MAG: cytochrome c oxidase assembly factor Coa1 family protein [Candidatus Sulfotelmatobacter sp.]